MSPIKVLHVVDLEARNYYLDNLCDFADATQVDFSFINFGSYGGFAKSLEERGKTVYCLNASSPDDYPRAVAEIWRTLKVVKPDIVHTHLFNPSLIALTLAKWRGLKTVMTRHHSDLVFRIASSTKRKFYLSLERYMMRKADHIIAPSMMVRDVMVEKQNVPNEKVTVIPYGQSFERFDRIPCEDVARVRKELGMDKQLSIVFPSRLDHLKGHRYLFEALSPLIGNGIRAKLYLVGEGPYENELRGLAASYQLSSHVEFLGWRDDVLTVISAADLLVQPSLSEALSSVTIEALMLEKPVIATDVSGVRDTLDGGKYGKIVPPGDSTALRSALLEILGDFESAMEKAKEGRKYLMNYMDARRVATAYSEVYKNLLSR
jgi:glycosyltransferase involved in cell wall biosynthesis